MSWQTPEPSPPADASSAASSASPTARARAVVARLAARPLLTTAVAFAVGLLLGWTVLGWWLAPVEWVDALPADLVADEQDAYVQLVADLYVRDQRLQPAVERLTSFRSAGDDTRLAELFGRLTEPGRDAASSENVRRLAGAIGIAPRAPATPTEAVGGSLDDGVRADVGRVAAFVLLLLAVAGGVYLARSWAVDRTGVGADDDARDGARRSGGARRRRGGAAEPSGASDAGAALYAERAPGYAPPDRPFEHTQPLELPESLTRGRTAQTAPQWRPGRIDLGTPSVAEYDGTDAPFYLTWLVYDEHSSLVGSTALKAVRVGSVTTLDLWFYERDETSDAVERPTITLVTRAAAREPVLRARLGDRRLVEAVPGATASLAAGDLELEVTVLDGAQAPDVDGLSLARLRLGLLARRAQGRPMDDDADPPVPLPFRR